MAGGSRIRSRSGRCKEDSEFDVGESVREKGGRVRWGMRAEDGLRSLDQSAISIIGLSVLLASVVPRWKTALGRNPKGPRQVSILELNAQK